MVALALELEQGAAETYVADVGARSDANAKKVTASIMGVEAQHASILLAVQALLAGKRPSSSPCLPTSPNCRRRPAPSGSPTRSSPPTRPARPPKEHSHEASKPSPEVMAISEHELTVMTSDLEQIHNDVGMPAMQEAINEWTERSRTSRRGFLIGAGALAGGAVWPHVRRVRRPPDDHHR